MEFDLRQCLQILMVASLLVQAGFAVATMWVHPFVHDQMIIPIGISGGYLITACSAFVRSREAREPMIAAFLSTWAFWTTFALSQSGFVHILEALIYPAVAIMFFCDACLVTGFYGKWLLPEGRFRFGLMQGFVWMTVIAVVCLLTANFPEVMWHLMLGLLPLVPGLMACFVLAITDQLGHFVWYLVGCAAGLLIYWLTGWADEEVITFVQTQLITVGIGGAALLLFPRDVDAFSHFDSPVESSRSPEELMADPLDDSRP